MNGYNAQSDRFREAMAVRDQRYTRNGSYRPSPVRPTNATEAASSGDVPPWKLKENGGADLTISLCLGGGAGHGHENDGEDMGYDMPMDMSYYEAMRRMGRVPESALYPQRRFRETLDPMNEAELNAKRRNALDNRDFALPGRRYPIDTPARARAALARGQANATPAEYQAIVRAVKRRYPDMDIEATTKSRKN